MIQIPQASGNTVGLSEEEVKFKMINSHSGTRPRFLSLIKSIFAVGVLGLQNGECVCVFVIVPHLG